MPSENTTLERIQKEISEEIQREKELKRLHSEQFLHYSNNNNGTDNESSCGSVNGDAKSEDLNSQPSLSRAQSTSSLLNGSNGFNGYHNGINGEKPNAFQQNGNSKNHHHSAFRLFAPNPQTRGVMHRFLKSRGKINTVNAFTNGAATATNGDTNNTIANKRSWVLPEFLEPTKVTIDPSKCIRKGFVPVEERMRKEFQEMHVRELELKKERRKSQPEFLSLNEDDNQEENANSLETPLRAAKSMAQLYRPEDFSDNGDSGPSAPSSLKPARSLAELCNIDDESELLTPSSLISKFETIIRKNQQART